MAVKEPKAIEPPAGPVTPNKGVTWWPLAVLVAINILNFYDRQVAGAVVEPVRKEFSLSDTQIGFLNTAFTVLYGIVGLPLGRLADKISRKKLLAVGVTVWALFTASSKWIQSYTFLMISRLGVGIGEATAAPTATSWIGDLYPAKGRSKPLALFMLGVPVGGALSFFFSGPIAHRLGWRAAMLVAAAPALVLVPLLLMLHEPERGAAETRKPDEKAVQLSPFLQRIYEWVDRNLSPFLLAHPGANRAYRWLVREALPILGLLCIPTFWWIAISGALVNFNLYAIGVFLPAFFGRIHRMNVAQAGITTGIVYAIGGIAGGSLAGIWGDRVVHRGRSGRMLVAAVAAFLAAPLAYVGIKQGYGHLVLAVALITAAYGLLNMYYGLVYASIQDIVPPALRGTGMAIYFLVMYLLGASWGSVVVGGLSDRFARHAASAAGVASVTEAFKAIGLQQALLAIPVLSLALSLVLWAGSRTMARDLQTS